ncbi:MAG: SDR family NAD(P)-dependent oxidoreductase [Candidatus Tectimicrobiota bacterium]
MTEAGRGIGRATALELLRLGAESVAAARNRDTAERTAADVRAGGRQAMALPHGCDT